MLIPNRITTFMKWSCLFLPFSSYYIELFALSTYIAHPIHWEVFHTNMCIKFREVIYFLMSRATRKIRLLGLNHQNSLRFREPSSAYLSSHLDLCADVLIIVSCSLIRKCGIRDCGAHVRLHSKLELVRNCFISAGWVL